MFYSDISMEDSCVLFTENAQGDMLVFLNTCAGGGRTRQDSYI